MFLVWTKLIFQAGLLAQLSPALGLVLAGVDLVLAGVLLLVGQILGALGLNLNPILGSRKSLVSYLIGYQLIISQRSPWWSPWRSSCLSQDE